VESGLTKVQTFLLCAAPVSVLLDGARHCQPAGLA
jgi:hypothetical protein